MKLLAVALSCVTGTIPTDNENKLLFDEMQEERFSVQADNNIRLVLMHLQRMFWVEGEDWKNKPRQMLNYGCYCQLIARRPGVGEPLDSLDE